MATLTDLLTSKIPPQNLEAERAILGAILLENETLPRAIEILTPPDFYKEGHRKLFSTMIGLFERNEPVDLLTLSEELRRRGELDEVGGPAALAALVEEAATAAHFGSYAVIVREKALLRELIRIATEVIGQSYEAKEDVESLLDQAERMIFQISERRLQGTAIQIRTILRETYEHIEQRYERKEHVTGVPTGFTDLDQMTSGLQDGDFVIVAGRPSMGKAQPLDANVKTLTGWKRMGELRLGDELASVDGRRSRVAGLFPQGVEQLYRVTFSDGRSTEVSGNHLWRIYYRGWREPRTLTTECVAEMLRAKRYRHRLWIDMPSGDYGHSQALPLDPWLLGALLGDGTLSGSSLRFSTSQQEMLERLGQRAGEGFLLRAVGGYDWRIVQASGAHRKGLMGVAPNGLMEALRSLGLWGIRSGEKFVPDIYLTAAREPRLELLRGLMDTDGWVERWGSTRFCSSSERLARDVAELVRSLGGWCSVRKRSTTRGRAFVCNIHYAEPKSVFRLSFKRDRAWTEPRRKWRPVVLSIVPSRVTETQCIAVTHPSGLYITDDYVVTHNTAFALNVAQHVGCEPYRKQVLIFSLEMSKEQLVQRLLCSEARVDSHRVRTGYMESKDWPRLTNALGRLADSRIFVDDSAALSVLEARAKARRMKAEHGLDLVIIDYLQLMRGRGGAENRQQEISEISRSLKALAKELRLPVVGLSQLSRAVETRGTRDYRPQLSDLRECVTGETLVVLGDGRRIPIRDLVGTAPEVWAMSPEGRLVVAKSEKIWRVGVRPVFAVQLASGRVIRATERHRLYAAQGWRTVGDLAAGDRVAIARRLPEPAFPECWSDLRALRGTAYGGSSHFRFAPSRTVLAEYAEILNDEELYGRATNDLFWDRIVAIQAEGEEDVFDLTVPGPASWLADGVVSHNSGALEQDGDLIIFLYRPERYKKEEEIREEDRNLAEVIVGKQRNGPTGTIRLTFLPEYARFEKREVRRQPF